MSPIIDLQTRFRELGRLRAGEKTASGAPKKRSEWRLTSPSLPLIEAAAALYGGTPKEWEGAPTAGKQYELYTTTDSLDVLIPPGNPLSQWNEQWSGGGCVKRCDGITNMLDDSPCSCPADPDERSELAKNGQACKPTTRLSVILPRLPDVGVWRLEAHGYNAAVELPGTVNILAAASAGGRMVEANLRLDQRTSKSEGQTRHFIVPVLEIAQSVHALTTGEIVDSQVGQGGAAIGAAQPALAAAPTPPPSAPNPGTTAPNPGTTRAQPPLPGEEVPPNERPFTKEDEVLVLPVWYKSFARTVREAGFDDNVRHALVAYGTNGRTRSSKAVLKTEAAAVKAAWESLQAGELAEVVAEDGTVNLAPVNEAATA